MTPFVTPLLDEDFINESLDTNTLLQVSCKTVHPLVKRIIEATAADPVVDMFTSIIDGQVAECVGMEYASRFIRNAKEKGMVEMDEDGSEVVVIPVDFFPDYLKQVTAGALLTSKLAEQELGANESNFVPTAFLALFDAVVSLLNASEIQDTEAADQAMRKIIEVGIRYSDALTRIGINIVPRTPLPDEDSLNSNMDEPPDDEEFSDIDF